MLAEINRQESDLMSAIDRSYNQIHYSNSIVNGYLSSIAEVHDAQQQVLDKIGLEGLGDEIENKLTSLSNNVGSILKKAKSGESQITALADQLQNAVSGMGQETPGSQLNLDIDAGADVGEDPSETENDDGL